MTYINHQPEGLKNMTIEEKWVNADRSEPEECTSF